MASSPTTSSVASTPSSPSRHASGDSFKGLSLTNPRTQDVFQSIVKGRKSWKTLRGGEVVWPPELEAALIEGATHVDLSYHRLTDVHAPLQQALKIINQTTQGRRGCSDGSPCETGLFRTGSSKRPASDAPQSKWAVVFSSSEIHAGESDVSDQRPLHYMKPKSIILSHSA